MAIPVPGRVVEALRRSTVQIHLAGDERTCAGAGIVIQPDAVITNAHVIRSTKVSVGHWDGKAVRAHVTHVDRRRDLALLAVPGLSGSPVTLGDSRLVKAGTPVAALGHPLGFVGALSSGVIHSVRHGAAHPNGAALDWICADVRLAPGNSGGPLIDFSGQLLGVNTMVISGGLALAVPSRAVEAFLKRSQHGLRLGVSLRPVQLASGTKGLLILHVEKGGAAAAASLLPGDILIAAGGKKVDTSDDLQLALEEASNALLSLEFLRGDLSHTRQVAVLLEQAARSAA